MTPDMNPGQHQRDSGDPFATDVAASLERIATTMADPGTTLAQGAMRRATTIRRRRVVTAVAAAAAAVAVAVPVGWQAFGPNRAGSGLDPARPGASAAPTTVTSTTVASTAAVPTAQVPPEPVETYSASGVGAASGAAATDSPSTTTLAMPIAAIGSVDTPETVLPYIVSGTYHGESGTGSVGDAPVRAALLLSDAVVILTGAAPETSHVEIWTLTGERRATLTTGGTLVANADLSRFAFVDRTTSTAYLYDSAGTLIAEQPVPDGSLVARGFSGAKVALSTPDAASGRTSKTPSQWWDPTARTLTADSSLILDVNDTSDRVLTVSTAGGEFCWFVSAVAGQGPARGKGCDLYQPLHLSYDGKAVLGRSPGPSGDLFIADVESGQLTSAIHLGEGLTLLDWDYRPSQDQSVLAVRDATGRSALLACTPSDCRTIAPAVADSPYVIVRQ